MSDGVKMDRNRGQREMTPFVVSSSFCVRSNAFRIPIYARRIYLEFGLITPECKYIQALYSDIL